MIIEQAEDRSKRWRVVSRDTLTFVLSLMVGGLRVWLVAYASSCSSRSAAVPHGKTGSRPPMAAMDAAAASSDGGPHSGFPAGFVVAVMTSPLRCVGSEGVAVEGSGVWHVLFL